MTYKAVRPIRVQTMGPALFGLHGAGCGCGACDNAPLVDCVARGEAFFAAHSGLAGSRRRPARAAGLGTGPIANYLFSETEAARALANDYDSAVLVAGISSGAIAGALGAVLKKPLLALAAGALTGLLVYQSQRPAPL